MPKRYSTNSKYEDIAGYSRAFRSGPFVYVSGTTAIDEKGEVVGAGDPYKQTMYILQKIEKALKGVGAEINDVVRTRMFVSSFDDWQEIGRAHKEVFGDVLPATTMVKVNLILPEMVLEMEADAILGSTEW